MSRRTKSCDLSSLPLVSQCQCHETKDNMELASVPVLNMCTSHLQAPKTAGTSLQPLHALDQGRFGRKRAGSLSVRLDKTIEKKVHKSPKKDEKTKTIKKKKKRAHPQTHNWSSIERRRHRNQCYDYELRLQGKKCIMTALVKE